MYGQNIKDFHQTVTCKQIGQKHSKLKKETDITKFGRNDRIFRNLFTSQFR